MEFFTKPREIEPRFALDGDQLAIFATHYDTANPITPIRTTNLAVMGEPLVTWVTLLENPRLKPKSSGTFLLTFACPPDKIVTREFKEREQVVIRQAVQVDPWDLPAECLRAVDGGTCYMPRKHPGACDPDVTATGVVPERAPTDEVECEGHESLDGASMGESVYCDGSCRRHERPDDLSALADTLRDVA